MIGLTLFEVCELATKRVDDRPSQPSAQQEYALAEDDLLSYAFNQALRGWTFQEIQQDLQLTQAVLVDVFIRLEKLGLIELLPGNEIKLRTAKEVRWAPNGAFSRKANQWLTRVLDKVNIDEPNGVWAHDTLKLSPASRVQLARKFEALLLEAQALSDADRRANDPTRDWHGLVLVARQIDIRRPVPNHTRD
jgi:hypothetical protein